MSFSPGRAQTEPLAALVAVFALGVGLSLYVGAFDATMAALVEDADLAPTAADRLEREASSFGTVQPPIGAATEAARPAGRSMNASLRTERRTWHGGPTPTGSTECVRRTVSVRTEPGTVRPGRLEVCVWPER